MIMNRNTNPSIAVLVPNWNDARYLPRCLRSVLDQSLTPDEFVIVDDCSTDDSVAVIRATVGETPYVKVVALEKNQGVYGAVAEGLRHITSDYVLFLSANDFVLPGIFDRAQKAIALGDRPGLWSALAWLVDDVDRPLRLQPSPLVSLSDTCFTPRDCLRLAHVHGNWFTGTTLIYRRDVLEEMGGFDPAYGGLSDLITALSIATRYGAAYSPSPCGIIRVHEGSVLSGTLRDYGRLEKLLERLSLRGPALSPALWTPGFLLRTALRFRFAAVRAAEGRQLTTLAGFVGGVRGAMLRLIDRVVPQSARRTRIAGAFLMLRPFDVLPTVVHRVLGGLLIRTRLRMEGHRAPE